MTKRWLVLLIATVCAWPAHGRPQRALDVDIDALFTNYKRGDYSTFETNLQNVENWTPATAAIRRRRAAWPPRAAAAFALEVAAAAASAGQSVSLVRSLVESGCAYVRGSGSAMDSTFQGHWHESALAVLHGQDAEAPNGRQVGDTWEHFDHVKALSRDVPVLRLGLAIMHEQRLHFADVGQGVAFRAPDVLRASSTLEMTRRAREVELFRLWRSQQLDEARELYSNLLAESSVGREAKLRLGVVQVKAGKVEEAMELFGQVVMSEGDPWTRFLAYVFVGRVLLTLDKPVEAAAAFGRALEARPQAASALLGRAAASAMAGKQVEASRDAWASLTSVGGADPWSEYPLGTYRNWPALRQRLREMSK